MRKLEMVYLAPTEGRGFVGTKKHTVQGDEVRTDEDGEYTFIRAYGSGGRGDRPLLEDFRVRTLNVVSVHESEVQA